MGSVLLSTGQTLTQDRLRTVLARSGISNYVQDGLSITVDYSNATMDVTAGLAFALHNNNRDVTFVTDAVAGQSIPSDGVNDVHLATEQVGQNPPEYRERYVVGQGEPSGPSLLVGRIDMGAQSVGELNRATPVTDALAYKGNDIDADADGVVNRAEWANNVNGSDIDGALSNVNQEYDTDGNGTVDTAESANSVDGADVAGQVAQAGNADTLGGDPPGAFADAGHTHSGYIRDNQEGALDVASANRAGTADRLAGLDPRSLSAAIGQASLPGVELGGGGSDNKVFHMEGVRNGYRMYLSKVYLSGRSGGSVSGVEIRVTNTRTGDAYTFSGRLKVGTFYSFPFGDIRFEAVNTSGSPRTVSAKVHYVIQQD